MAEFGILRDIAPQGSITVVTIETDDGGARYVYAETRLFLNAIDDAFDGLWSGAEIEFESDDCGLLQSFEPA